MSSTGFYIILLSFASSIAAVIGRTDTTYFINESLSSGYCMVGTITTDGSIGQLLAANILEWDMEVGNGEVDIIFNSAFPNHAVKVYNSSLFATSTGLSLGEEGSLVFLEDRPFPTRDLYLQWERRTSGSVVRTALFMKDDALPVTYFSIPDYFLNDPQIIAAIPEVNNFALKCGFVAFACLIFSKKQMVQI